MQDIQQDLLCLLEIPLFAQCLALPKQRFVILRINRQCLIQKKKISFTYFSRGRKTRMCNAMDLIGSLDRSLPIPVLHMTCGHVGVNLLQYLIRLQKNPFHLVRHIKDGTGHAYLSLGLFRGCTIDRRSRRWRAMAIKCIQRISD